MNMSMNTETLQTLLVVFGGFVIVMSIMYNLLQDYLEGRK